MFKIDKKEVNALAASIKRGQIFRYSKGSQTELLERIWAEKIGVKYALATNSGTSSLICALVGMGIGPGDEVIVPGYTFIATAAAVLAVGAIPILAEVDATLTLDAKDVEKKISPYTKALIPVHMQGMPCDMEALMAVAKKHGVRVCEDACQADGGSYRGKRLGSIGDAGAHSFNFYKIIGAGEGGALVTSDRDILERGTIQHDCGNAFFSDKPMHVPLFMGWNFRMSELLGTVLCVQVGRLDGILKALRAERNWFKKELAGALEFAPSNDDAGDCGTTLVLRFPSADAAERFNTAAKEQGVGGVHSPIHTGKHVYTNWQAVLEKQGGHHPERNPYRFAKREITYSKDMLPSTLDLLARSSYVPMHIKHTRKDWKRMADGLRVAAAKA